MFAIFVYIELFISIMKVLGLKIPAVMYFLLHLHYNLRMDFDKQYRSGAPTSMINKGRGFIEKPLVKPTASHRQPRARAAPRKITSKTQLYLDLSAD